MLNRQGTQRSNTKETDIKNYYPFNIIKTVWCLILLRTKYEMEDLDKIMSSIVRWVMDFHH